MIRHYFKVAFRNLWKYKSQTLISVVGLAVGFTCFALATLWIRYETSFDTFHKNANRIYCVRVPDTFSLNGVSRNTRDPLAAYLKETFPEISHAVPIHPSHFSGVEIEGQTITAKFFKTDSTFFSFFDVKIVEGSRDFLIPESKNLAVTREKARQLFGNENPVGKQIKIVPGNEEWTVCAIVTGFSGRSNYKFDFLCSFLPNDWGGYGAQTLIKLYPKTDVKKLSEKLYEHVINKGNNAFGVKNMTITPLTSIHYDDSEHVMRAVKFQHIVIFAVAGSLLILCTLFNYLTLFISRFRMRQRELALRTVFGASGRSLLAMLSVEFVISLIVALLLGVFILDLILPQFRSLSDIKPELSSVYSESLVYFGLVMLISLLVFVLTLAIFRRRNLNTVIRRSNGKLFRKISIVTQLVISITFAFCTTVILKQMYYLHNTDLGFSFKNRGSVTVWDKGVSSDVLDAKVKQIPEITETVAGFEALIPPISRYSRSIEGWDDKPEDAMVMMMEYIDFSEAFAAYYELQLAEGEMLNDADDKNYVMINESAAKTFGWHKSTGKSFSGKTVKGVIKNIYSFAPTIAAKPYFYSRPSGAQEKKATVLFKYEEGTWKSCKSKIEQAIKEEYSQMIIHNAEEAYGWFLASENTLLKILTSISLVCIIICVFGFVSLVSLTCEERRKEIAIRKINGATIKDILDIFFKEYITLLVISAVIAFPAGYYIMRRWLEDYVVQTPISAWIYAVILLMLIMSIILCVGWKVYKTSRENP
ncbi:MAG: ABC transporter permease, partial [Dysgonamonadaceae bacterium]|nr:ABC transporter permease [Dysgonamonadaceae bacterium]